VTFVDPEAAGNRAIYAKVWCSPCVLDACDHMSCMRAISPEWVWDVVKETLDREEGVGAAAGPAGPVPTASLGARAKPGTP
jgi:hypothetical protein